MRKKKKGESVSKEIYRKEEGKVGVALLRGRHSFSFHVGTLLVYVSTCESSFYSVLSKIASLLGVIFRCKRILLLL